jgi:hypothetical protein
VLNGTKTVSEIGHNRWYNANSRLWQRIILNESPKSGTQLRNCEYAMIVTMSDGGTLLVVIDARSVLTSCRNTFSSVASVE